jgi:hypothetical protein
MPAQPCSTGMSPHAPKVFRARQVTSRQGNACGGCREGWIGASSPSTFVLRVVLHRTQHDTPPPHTYAARTCAYFIADAMPHQPLLFDNTPSPPLGRRGSCSLLGVRRWENRGPAASSCSPQCIRCHRRPLFCRAQRRGHRVRLSPFPYTRKHTAWKAYNLENHVDAGQLLGSLMPSLSLSLSLSLSHTRALCPATAIHSDVRVPKSPTHCSV